MVVAPSLLVVGVVWLSSQVAKYLIAGREGKPAIRVLFESGGMPSSHAATVAALVVMVGYEAGTRSTLFTVAMALAFVVCSDAMGVRRASGEQAKLLNRISDRVLRGGTSETKRLREELGHRPVEVAAGIGFGLIGAFILHGLI